MLNVLPRVVLLVSSLSLGACVEFVGYPDADYGSYNGSKSKVSYQFDSSCSSDYKKAIKEAGKGYFYSASSATDYSYQLSISCDDNINASGGAYGYNVLAMLTFAIVPMKIDNHYGVSIDIKNAQDEHVDYFFCKDGKATNYSSAFPFSIPFGLVAAVHPNIKQVHGSRHAVFRQLDQLADGAVAQSADSCFQEIISSGVLK
ncbi:hypothetical protein OAV62_00325 [bacterium]|nr:hypothetical protein [bacterium]